jgi:hypothetical protein
VTNVDYVRQAEEYRREVGRCYYRARRDARRAAKEYKRAAYFRTHANWLTLRPDLWDLDGTGPASYEMWAESTESYADTLLQCSFRYTRDAHFYSDLARDYDALEARRQASIREWA